MCPGQHVHEYMHVHVHAQTMLNNNKICNLQSLSYAFKTHPTVLYILRGSEAVHCIYGRGGREIMDTWHVTDVLKGVT